MTRLALPRTALLFAAIILISDCGRYASFVEVQSASVRTASMKKSQPISYVIQPMVVGPSEPMDVLLHRGAASLEKGSSTGSFVDSATAGDEPTISTQVSSSSNLINSAATARGLILLASFLHAIDYSFTKIIQRSIRPEVANSIRYLVAMCCFLPDLSRMHQDWRSVRIGMELGMWCGLASVSLGYALQHKPAGKVAFIGALGVLMPPVYNFCADWFIKKSRRYSASLPDEFAEADTYQATAMQKLTRWILTTPAVAPLLAIGGAMTLKLDDVGGASWSDLLMVFTPICYSLAVWRTEREAKFAPYDFKVSSAIMLSTASFLSAMCAIVRYGAPSLSWFLAPVEASRMVWMMTTQNVSLVAILIFSSIFCLGWTVLIEQTTLQVITSTEAYVLLSMEPIFAVLCARVLLGELISPNTWCAAAFIIAACSWKPLSHALLRSLVRRQPKAVDTALNTTL